METPMETPLKPLRACHVLVTPTSYGYGDARLRTELEQRVGRVTYNSGSQPLSGKQLAELLPGVDGYIAGLDDISAEALQSADRLQVIARYGVGVDNVDLGAARRLGIVVTNTPGANARAVAELTVAFLLLLARPIFSAVQATRQGGWPRSPGLSLENRTVGLLGLGAVGRQVARRLSGFDCRVLAHDLAPDVTFAKAHNVALVTLDELLAEADFVSLHLPLLPETRVMVNAAFLQKMKRGSCLINTARGELIDEQALYEALVSERLRGAALDALRQEPPPAGHPLLSLPQVLATPHMGAHTDGAMNTMGWQALNDCLAVLQGEEPRYRVV